MKSQCDVYLKGMFLSCIYSWPRSRVSQSAVLYKLDLFTPYNHREDLTRTQKDGAVRKCGKPFKLRSFSLFRFVLTEQARQSGLWHHVVSCKLGQVVWKKMRL